MSLQLLTPPQTEPVSLAEAKAHLKVDTSDEDALIATLITAARARAEWHTGRAFITQHWRHYFDVWPLSDSAELLLPPLISVEDVTVTDANGTRTVLDPSSYRVDTASTPGRVIFATRPKSLRTRDCLEITFTAGYGEASAVPAAIKAAILAVIADLYTHRGDDDALVGRAGQALLAPYRVFKL
jgi:uncharacterized phiE125 gp8 family phage protein